MNEKSMIFSCNHQLARLTFQDGLIFTAEEAFGNGFYAMHHAFGCSKNYASREEAVRQMLKDHGCTDIFVSDWPESLEPDFGPGEEFPNGEFPNGRQFKPVSEWE